MCGVPRFNGDSGTVAIYQCAAFNLAHLSNYICLSSLLFPGNGSALITLLILIICCLIVLILCNYISPLSRDLFSLAFIYHHTGSAFAGLILKSTVTHPDLYLYVCYVLPLYYRIVDSC